MGDKDQVPFKEFYDSMLNWAEALHNDAVVGLEQAEKGKYGQYEDGDELDDANTLSSRIHSTLIAVTTGEPRKLVKSVPRGALFFSRDTSWLPTTIPGQSTTSW